MEDEEATSASGATVPCSATLSVDSVKEVAESVGVSNLPDDVAKELAEEVTHRVKGIVQEALKFMEMGGRQKLNAQDIDLSLKVQNIEPVCGMEGPGALRLPFRIAGGGGREMHFTEGINDEELSEVWSGSISNIPRQVSGICLQKHWLAINGVQPQIPENPPPSSMNLQENDSIYSSNKSGESVKDKGPVTPTVGNPHRFKTTDQVYVLQLATHELTQEQQTFYKEITEACVGSDKKRRTEALHSLSYDPELYEMLPRLCTFIAEGVRVNVVHKNLTFLIYLMKMVKSLLDNKTLNLEKYLHEIIPSICTCIVSKELCLRPEKYNHWVLRDFASKLMAHICKNYTTATNNIQTRVINLLSSAFSNDKSSLASLYGAVAGLSELGNEVIQAFVIPKLEDIGTRVELRLEEVGYSEANSASAEKIKELITKKVCPVLQSSRKPPDLLEEYKAEYGYFGASLQMGVVALRNPDLQSSTSNAAANEFVAVL